MAELQDFYQIFFVVCHYCSIYAANAVQKGLLNGTLLPDVRPTAGKCQADSREQNGD
jgi:hypothetical protein